MLLLRNQVMITFYRTTTKNGYMKLKSLTFNDVEQAYPRGGSRLAIMNYLENAAEGRIRGSVN